MTAKLYFEAIQRMLEPEAGACATDIMLYGRTLICITPDAVNRVPPEDWYALADDIIISKRKPPNV